MGDKLSFFVLNDSQCYNSLDGKLGHQSLMSITGDNGQDKMVADDWIVSNKIKATSASSFSFDARSWESTTSVMPGKCATLTVLVAESEPDNTSSFTQTGSQKTLPLYDGKWEHYTFDLSAYAGKEIYVALRSVVEDGLGSFFDNFEFAHFEGETNGLNTVSADSLHNEYVTVYSVGGMKLAEGKNVLNSMPKGLYIVKTGTKTFKVMK